MISYENENVLKLIFTSTKLRNFKGVLEVFNKTLYKIHLKVRNSLFLSLGDEMETLYRTKAIYSLSLYKDNNLISFSESRSGKFVIKNWNIKAALSVGKIKINSRVFSAVILPNEKIAS
jgi:hypothetical protein